VAGGTTTDNAATAAVAAFADPWEYNEVELDALVDAHLGDSSVVCPLCMVRPVQMHGGVLACACGLQLDLRATAWTLPTVGRRLMEVTEQHSERCAHVPRFRVGCVFPSTLKCLVMECAACGEVQLVL